MTQIALLATGSIASALPFISAAFLMVCAAWLGAVGTLGKLLKQYEDDKARAIAEGESAPGPLSSPSFPSSISPTSERIGSEVAATTAAGSTLLAVDTAGGGISTPPMVKAKTFSDPPTVAPLSYGLRESTAGGPSCRQQGEGDRSPGDLSTGQPPAAAGMTSYWDAAAAASGDGVATGDDVRGQTTDSVVIAGGRQPGVEATQLLVLRGNGDSGPLASSAAETRVGIHRT